MTPGAGGPQPDGKEHIRTDCIPAELCQTILYVSNGHPVEIEEEQARAVRLRSAPPERRRPRPPQGLRLEPVSEGKEEDAEKSDGEHRPTYRRVEEKTESKGASGSADRYEAERSVSPLRTEVQEGAEEVADRAEPAE